VATLDQHRVQQLRTFSGCYRNGAIDTFFPVGWGRHEMSTRLDEALIDLIGMNWVADHGGPWLVHADVPVDDENARPVLVAFVEAGPDWDDLAMMARCVASRRSCSTDHRRVTFASAHYGNPGSMYLADGTDDDVEISEAAALRLLARWFRVLVDGAEGQQLEVTTSSWWSEFVRDVETVEQQASSS
jgi:hypothetical protein